MFQKFLLLLFSLSSNKFPTSGIVRQLTLESCMNRNYHYRPIVLLLKTSCVVLRKEGGSFYQIISKNSKK